MQYTQFYAVINDSKHKTSFSILTHKYRHKSFEAQIYWYLYTYIDNVKKNFFPPISLPFSHISLTAITNPKIKGKKSKKIFNSNSKSRSYSIHYEESNKKVYIRIFMRMEKIFSIYWYIPSRTKQLNSLLTFFTFFFPFWIPHQFIIVHRKRRKSLFQRMQTAWKRMLEQESRRKKIYRA